MVLQSGQHRLETYAILDDGSERTILLQAAAEKLKLKGEPEDMVLHTVRQDLQTSHGSSVTFTVSPAAYPQRTYKIKGAFTSANVALAGHTQPVSTLQRKYKHLRGQCLFPLNKAQPLLLIGSDQPHLITPKEPVRLCPPGGPAAVKTRLGWTLQGPTKSTRHSFSPQQCLHLSTVPMPDELWRNVERL